MTLQDVRDIFINDYKIECVKRNVKEISFNEKQVYLMMHRGLKEVQRKLNILESSTEISLVNGTQTYSLPSDFGNQINVKVLYESSPLFLTEVSKDEIDRTISDGEPLLYAIYFDGNTGKIKLYPTPTNSGTLTITYYKKIVNYSPSSDSIDLTETIPLPDEYIELVIIYMLSLLFDDKLEQFTYQARQSKRVSSVRQIKYDIGGLDA